MYEIQSRKVTKSTKLLEGHLLEVCATRCLHSPGGLPSLLPVYSLMAKYSDTLLATVEVDRFPCDWVTLACRHMHYNPSDLGQNIC